MQVAVSRLTLNIIIEEVITNDADHAGGQHQLLANTQA